ncbi:hypothetical protein LINGRAHAP2_LOCUS2133, partial [Linum grandiflorum]
EKERVDSSQVPWFLLFTSKRFSTYKSCCCLLSSFALDRTWLSGCVLVG